MGSLAVYNPPGVMSTWSAAIRETQPRNEKRTSPFTWSWRTTCAKDYRVFILITHNSTRSDDPVTWVYRFLSLDSIHNTTHGASIRLYRQKCGHIARMHYSAMSCCDSYIQNIISSCVVWRFPKYQILLSPPCGPLSLAAGYYTPLTGMSSLERSSYRTIACHTAPYYSIL